MADETTDTIVSKDVQGDGKPPDERMFTQSEMSAQIVKRLRREREKYADYDDLKAAKAQLDEIEQERLTELEKVQKRVADAEKERDEARQQVKETAIHTAFMLEAVKAGALHPDDAYRLADRSAVAMSDDGKVQGAVEAVAALLTGNRLVLKGRPAPGLDAGAGGGDRSSDRAPTLTADEIEMAGKLGLTAEEYQKGKR